MKLAAKRARIFTAVVCLGILFSAFQVLPALAGRLALTAFTDIAPGALSSNPAWLAAFGDQLFFIADNSANGPNPMITDGTPEGTRLIKAISNTTDKLRAASYQRVLVTQNTVFFTIGPLLDYFYPEEVQLWKTDGTESGTVEIPISAGNIAALTAWGDDLYIIDSSSGVVTLMVYDGASVTVVKEIKDTTLTASYQHNFTSQPILLNNTLYFLLWHGRVNELWRSDGTPAGTVLVASVEDIGFIPGGPMITANGKIYLRANGKIHQSTGAVGSLELVEGDYSMGAHTRAFASNGSALFFVTRADPITNKSDLYTITGQGAQPHKLAENVDYNLVPVNGRVYFYAFDSANNLHLGRTDGTPAGTMILLPPSANYNALLDQVVELDGKVYFLAKNASGETELWSSDGTPAGTAALAYFTPPQEAADSNWLAAAGGALYFSGDDGARGMELMRYFPAAPRTNIYIPVIWR